MNGNFRDFPIKIDELYDNFIYSKMNILIALNLSTNKQTKLKHYDNFLFVTFDEKKRRCLFTYKESKDASL